MLLFIRETCASDVTIRNDPLRSPNLLDLININSSVSFHCVFDSLAYD